MALNPLNSSNLEQLALKGLSGELFQLVVTLILIWLYLGLEPRPGLGLGTAYAGLVTGLRLCLKRHCQCSRPNRDFLDISAVVSNRKNVRRLLPIVSVHVALQDTKSTLLGNGRGIQDGPDKLS